jgi:hypothetical protein
LASIGTSTPATGAEVAEVVEEAAVIEFPGGESA